MQEEPTARQYLLSGLFLMIVGWGGLALLLFIFRIPPLVWARWGFFALWLTALAGTALPIVYYLNVRFPTEPRTAPHAIVRQALWVGVYGAALAWLQLGHLATLWVWLGLGGGLIAIEYLLGSRERARWSPPQEPEAFPEVEAHMLGGREAAPAEADERPE